MNRSLSFALLAGLSWAWAAPAMAQGFNLSSKNDAQIEVFADDGIEWISDGNRVVARGHAKAVRGRITVTADTLTAYYRNGDQGGGNEIWRLDADGAVTIKTDTETATGTKASYDLDKAIFVLRGQPAKIVTPKDTITARDTLEYWEKQRMAVARGDALAIQGDRRIQADVLSGYFKDGAKGSLELSRADAFGHVTLITAKEKVTGEKADYNVDNGVATVTGSVKITRDGNELNGGYAHVNLNTGISKLFGSTPGQGDGRVRGTFTPEKKGDGQSRAVFQGSGPKSTNSTPDQAQGQ